jgi:hypothetical protein
MKEEGKLKAELTFHQKAEAAWAEKQLNSDSVSSESEILRLVHKLEVQKIELEMVNKELLFQNDKKTQRSDELILANIELPFQNKEKEKRAEALLVANKLVTFQLDRLEEIA